MNTEEIDRILRRYVIDFDGVFSANTLPEKPRLLVCNTDASDKPGSTGYVCISRTDVENISTRSGGDLLRISNVTWTDTAYRGRLIVDNYRVLLVNFADIIVFIIVRLEVEV